MRGGFLNSFICNQELRRAAHRGEGAVVGVVAGEQGGIPDEHGQSLQDERGEELDVDEIAGAAQPPVDEP